MDYGTSRAFWNKALSNIELKTHSKPVPTGVLASLQKKLEKAKKHEIQHAFLKTKNILNSVMDARPYQNKPWDAFGFCMKAIGNLETGWENTGKINVPIPEEPNGNDAYSAEEDTALYCSLAFLAECVTAPNLPNKTRMWSKTWRGCRIPPHKKQ